ncbi:MAG: MBL fold metallo-hydrolase [Vicinamibacterales bacterium]
MILETRAVPPFYKNGFVLGWESGAGVLIDPGDEIEHLLEIVAARRLDIRAILLTHGHVDHVSGVARAKAALGAPVWLHEADLPLYLAAEQQAAFFGLRVEKPPAVDRFLEPGEVIPLPGGRIVAHHTPGHSPGGVCLELRTEGEKIQRLFVGDTLFAGSIGRTDLPGGDYSTLIHSIKEVLFPLGDDAIVHPGHGETTTIGAERRNNPFLA